MDNTKDGIDVLVLLSASKCLGPLLRGSAVPQDFAPQLYNGQCEAGTGPTAPGRLTFESRGTLHDTTKSPDLGYLMIFVYGFVTRRGLPEFYRGT